MCEFDSEKTIYQEMLYSLHVELQQNKAVITISGFEPELSLLLSFKAMGAPTNTIFDWYLMHGRAFLHFEKTRRIPSLDCTVVTIPYVWHVWRRLV